MTQFFWKTAFTLYATLHFTQAWQLVCFNGSISNSFNVTLENATKQITSGYIDINKPTVICTHGYKGSIFTQGINLLIEAYLLLGINVCACDYSKEADIGPISGVNYPVSVVAAAYGVAKEMAQAIVNLEHFGLNVKTMHLVGHSLGAHVFGNTGAFYKTMTGNTIFRITGLDAAGPGFDGNIYLLQRIDKEDADFVVLIHTDPGFGRYGMAVATGHLDFYPCPNEYRKNGVQPGCPPVIPFVSKSFTPEDACSHQRSVRLHLDALIYGCQQLAAKADNVTEWSSPSFVPNLVTCFGEDTNQTYRGKYYYRTNDKSPYGLGVAGQTAQ